MCTVTYLPQPSGFILTHNRDEAPARAAERIERERIGEERLLFPRDPRAGGAWMAAGERGRVACVLNGAFEKHRHAPPYRRSRGLVLLDFFAWPGPGEFFDRYDFEGIEPFTLVSAGPGRLEEFRWDGKERFFRELPAGRAQFWCSATLYPAPMRTRREQVFREWLAAGGAGSPSSFLPSPRSILDLHRTGSVGDPENDYIMNRSDRVRTVSITQAVVTSSELRMSYHNLLEKRKHFRRMTLLTLLARF
jgi:hypothetical protein